MTIFDAALVAVVSCAIGAALEGFAIVVCDFRGPMWLAKALIAAGLGVAFVGVGFFGVWVLS